MPGRFDYRFQDDGQGCGSRGVNIEPPSEMDPTVRFLPNTRPIGFLLPAAATAIAPAIPAAARPTKLRRVTPFGCGLVRSCNYFTLFCVYGRVEFPPAFLLRRPEGALEEGRKGGYSE